MRQNLCAEDSARYNASVERKRKAKPPRLERVFHRYDAPLYLVTFNTHARRPRLASPAVHAAFVDYASRAAEYEIAVGRYVIMPDHVHLFIAFRTAGQLTLGSWVKGLKRHLEIAIAAAGHTPIAMPRQKLASIWQPGFHDHLLRSSESYAQKWDYVRDNPVRAGLVKRADDWEYAGEITVIDRA